MFDSSIGHSAQQQEQQFLRDAGVFGSLGSTMPFYLYGGCVPRHQYVPGLRHSSSGLHASNVAGSGTSGGLMSRVARERNRMRRSTYASTLSYHPLPSHKEEEQMIISPPAFAWASRENFVNMDGSQAMLDDLSMEDVYGYANDSRHTLRGAHLLHPYAYGSMPQGEHEQQWQQQQAGVFDAHAIFQYQNDDDFSAMTKSTPYQASATSSRSLGNCSIGASFSNSGSPGSSPAGNGSPGNKSRTYMQWVKRQRRTQQRAARRRSDAAAGRFNCQVPDCGKKYSSSGGIRYHLRNCENEGLPQTASSLAQLAEARAKEDTAIKRKEAPATAAEDAAESDEDRSPQDTSYDEVRISKEGDLLSHSLAASPLRSSSRSSSMSSSPTGLVPFNAADVEFSFDLFDDSLPAWLPWQAPPLQYQHHQAATSSALPFPSSKAASRRDISMACLDGLGHVHRRASSWPDERQVPSSPRSLVSTFEAASDADEAMFGLFQDL